MSPVHFWFGPLALKSCFSRFLRHRQAVLTVADRAEFLAAFALSPDGAGLQHAETADGRWQPCAVYARHTSRAHRLNAEFSLMLLDKDILISGASREVCRGLLENGKFIITLCNCLLRRAISAACSLSRSEDVAWLCCLLRQL